MSSGITSRPEGGRDSPLGSSLPAPFFDHLPAGPQYISTPQRFCLKSHSGAANEIVGLTCNHVHIAGHRNLHNNHCLATIFFGPAHWANRSHRSPPSAFPCHSLLSAALYAIHEHKQWISEVATQLSSLTGWENRTLSPQIHQATMRRTYSHAAFTRPSFDDAHTPCEGHQESHSENCGESNSAFQQTAHRLQQRGSQMDNGARILWSGMLWFPLSAYQTYKHLVLARDRSEPRNSKEEL